MIRSCLGKARRLTFPGLKLWVVFRSSFGRLEYAQENVQTAEALRAWLPSRCPSGTKAIRPSTRHTIILALIGFTLELMTDEELTKPSRLLIL
jgi:hypothetical protein